MINSKASQDYQVKYKNMKKEYDELLEKNQNDLIKIKMREKQLNVSFIFMQEKIASYVKENQLLLEQIKQLKDLIKKKGVTSKSIQESSHADGQLLQLRSDLLNKNQ